MLILKILFIFLLINLVVLGWLSVKYEKKRTYDIDAEAALMKKRAIVASLICIDLLAIILSLVIWLIVK